MEYLNRLKHSRLIKGGTLYLIGGGGYVLLECLWRGHSHWSMFCLGGACFHLMGGIDRLRLPKAYRCGLCAAGVTAAELLCGCVVNLWWHMNVWDYSARPWNLLGQICPLFSVLWALLSVPGMWLYRTLSYKLLPGQSAASGQSVQRGRLAEQISRPK